MNTAMFSVVKAVLLSALPYPEPERLMQVWQTNKTRNQINASSPDFQDWKEQNQSFEYMATYDWFQIPVAGSFAPRSVWAAAVSEDFFKAFASDAAIGRTFTHEEQTPSGSPAIVLGYTLAQQLFGQSAQAAGKIIRAQGMAFTVVGVMPPGFSFPDKVQLWIPDGHFPASAERSAHNHHVLGRLKPKLSRRQAQSDMDVIAARLAKAYVDDRDQGIRVVSLYDEVVGPVRPALVVLLAAVGMVLLIAIVNISNLQMARTSVRIKELAMRAALGAQRGRLVRQLVTENVLLSLVGGAAGLLVALAGTALLKHYAPANIPRMAEARIDLGILFFTAVLSLGAGLLFGFLPAILSSRTRMNRDLKDGAANSSTSRQYRYFGNVLVVGQIALAIVLLTCATLLIKSYWKLAHVDYGLRPAGVFTTTISWATADGDSVNGEQVKASATRLLNEIGRMPGVQSAALINPLPVLNSGSNGNFEIAGRPRPADPHESPDAFYRVASRDYFKTFGLPVLQGRAFTERDDRSPEQVAIVNEAFVREFFQKANAVGQRIRFDGMEQKPEFMTIVGVVPDVRAFGLNKPTRSEVFVNYMQHAGHVMSPALIVRGPASLQPAIRKAISSVNPDAPVDFRTMEDAVGSTIARDQFQALLLGLFAGCALLLSAVGLYGLLSYTVSRRKNELGIRIALGADRMAVLALVLKEGAVILAGGLLFGFAGALIATPVLEKLLFSTSATDPAAFAVVSGVFTATALIACYLPAKRAMNVDPIVALRYE